jgi:adenylate cyclase
MKDGWWPKQRTDILDWLVNETSEVRFVDDIFIQLCMKLRRAGITVARGTLHLDSHNPEWLGARLIWHDGVDRIETDRFEYGVRDTGRYLNSPVHEIRSGASQLRRHLNDKHSGGNWYPIYDELRAEGLTDYAAWSVSHTLGKRHTVTFASDHPEGFSAAEIETIEDLLPALALVSEIRLKNRITRTLLETYVGVHAGEQILAGATVRGCGTTVSAAILICDLRNFTTISGLWPRDNVIDLLNGYFDAMCDPIERNGGEILKFMGDGLLAIFPLSNKSACEDLLMAVRQAKQNMAKLNAITKLEERRPKLGYGIGVHIGDVMYGNIGSRRRLDFTVIGPAVNIASRLEALTKKVKRKVLLSAEFVKAAGCRDQVDRLGSFSLHGVQSTIEVFAMSEE